MDEGIDLRKSGKLKDNITRFRQDKRLAVTGALYSLALLGMLAILVFCALHFREDLTAESLRRTVAYLKTASSAAEPFTEYRFETGLDTEYAPFGTGFAVSSADTYSYISGLGDSQYSLQLKYAAPAMCVSDKYILIYDRGGKGFCVASSYSEYLRETLDSPILSASMNRAGAFALVTNEAGYRAAVSVYSARQKLLCKWYTSQYYVLQTSVSPDSSHFAALCLSQQELQAVTQIRYFRIGQEEPVWTAELGERQVWSMTHDKSGGLLILCDDGVYRYDSEGACTASHALSQQPERFAAAEEGELFLVFSGASGSSAALQAMVVGDLGETVYQGRFSGTLRAIAADGGTAAILLTDRLELISYAAEGQPVRSVPSGGARDVVCSRQGESILIFSDRAEKVSDAQEEALQP